MSPNRTPMPPCTDQTVDPAVFFPERAEQLAIAQAICATCPLSAQCRSDALAVGTSDGVWGGVLLERGAVVAAKRRPGRSRKVAAAPSGAAA